MVVYGKEGSAHRYDLTLNVKNTNGSFIEVGCLAHNRNHACRVVEKVFGVGSVRDVNMVG